MRRGRGFSPWHTVHSGASLRCSACFVKSAHIVPADEYQMLYSQRKESVHSLKHIPGLMKKVDDGHRRYQRNQD